MDDLSAFLRSLGTLGAPPSPPAAAGGAPSGGSAGSAVLAFSMQAQTETDWCWAAVSASVVRFFNSASSWTQCLVANGTLSRTDCCAAGSSGPCNIPWYLDRALAQVQCFVRWMSGTVGLSGVQAEIAADRPLCIRVGWAGGGGHFLAIHGWQVTGSGDVYYFIDDPIYGRQTILKHDLEQRYQVFGRWTDCYYVAPPAAAPGGVATTAPTADDPELLGA